VESTVLRKRLNTFRLPSGQLRGVSGEVIMELLRAWESWPRTSAEFYRELGLKKHQLSSLIREGKKLVKSGVVSESEFKQISPSPEPSSPFGGPSQGMAVRVGDKIIGFGTVDQLVDFLKKMA